MPKIIFARVAKKPGLCACGVTSAAAWVIGDAASGWGEDPVSASALAAAAGIAASGAMVEAAAAGAGSTVAGASS